MVRNIVLLSGSSHPQLTETICTHLGIPPAKIHLSKFSVGETRVEIGDSVREKDVFIVQSGGGKVNDHLMELLITISACKTASARKVTAVLPLFPYSRQSDLPYNKAGAPLARLPTRIGSSGEADGAGRNGSGGGGQYASDSRPTTPHPGQAESVGMGGSNGANHLSKRLNGLSIGHKNGTVNGDVDPRAPVPRRKDTLDSVQSDGSYIDDSSPLQRAPTSYSNSKTGITAPPVDFKPQRGYKQWVAQAGTLVADLLTCAGADHIITMDLHDPQYQGFFDIPVDNLYGRHLLRKYIQHQILPKHGGKENCVIVSPDAGGAKRATNIADALGMDFALIHKERRQNPPATTIPRSTPHQQPASMLLVGAVANRTAILIDDLADTSNTITRAAKLLKKSGAATVYALVTHGVFSGDAVERIWASALDKVVVTNSVPQEEHVRRMEELARSEGRRDGEGNVMGGKLEVLEVGGVFAEAIRRVHHGESISVLFQYD
ncbi:ribose-phosphate pyrophosphokinase [Friedmanniomyces endolithicus]|uniref:ribose-phosphate diphosphokinase n=1 Tax=Friedmanniomyces endolithicus TaxID=329885 RepID=A0AAN6K856_9PEZI|nr:ribose-phosphate pyrophosphokinase [Friedmanniomyces endolithicus]KAK0785735.1 ribose-phosphate pyrophosphokinase [Friedmanniomyces endolithicus]KAK0814937.1 ribose-phosphate pyrophosphokinase [Friedmanniomyces endolithicus]KAK0820431.1 ribose-phosphate pyrophosphokinase [Friedmanniomyces endolithicus]KAK0849265.1 ribose-phosphate pyrophosphokinase [Friedmanniomyces endolithicus]